MGVLITGVLKSAAIRESNGRTFYNGVIEEEKYNASGTLIGADQYRVNILESAYPDFKKNVNQFVVAQVEAAAYNSNVNFQNAVIVPADVLLPV